MPQFQEHEIVKLSRPLPDSNLPSGCVGVIVMIYPESPQSYEVEFTDSNGFTTALLTLKEKDLEKYETERR